MLKEFREFISRGSVIDMAVGIIIGAAFGRIVTSFVNDILMPPIGLILGGIDFTNLFYALNRQSYPNLKAAQDAGAATINYGVFINTIIDFLIVAFVIFLLIRQVNRMRRPAPAAAPTTKECPVCATTIPLKARRCPNCTSELEKGALAPAD